MRLFGRGNGGDARGYDAFISYSHAVDGRLAPSLRRGLYNFARTWYRPRAVRVFHDKSSLRIGPGLWARIEVALTQSRAFVLLASPEAAASPWVAREIEAWLAGHGDSHRPGQLRADRPILIVLTDGQISWDPTVTDFDWATTTALPHVLRGVFDEEPLWLDLRWAHRADQVSLRHARFREAVATLSAAIRHRNKDDLLDEDVREWRRTRRLARAGVAALSALTLIAVGLGGLAYQQRKTAVAQRDKALTRLLVAEVDTLRESRPGVAKQLGLVAYGLDHNVGAAAVFAGQQTPGVFNADEPAHDVGMSNDGSTLATSTGDALVVRSLTDQGRSRVEAPADRTFGPVALAPAGHLLAIGVQPAVDATGTADIRLWHVNGATAVDPPAVLAVPDSAVNSVVFSPDNTILAAATSSGAIRLWRIASPTSTPVALTSIVAHKKWADSVAFAPDGHVLASAGGDGVVRLWDLTDPAHPTELSHVDATAPGTEPSKLGNGFTPRSWPHRVVFSDTGRLLATVTGKEAQAPKVWNLSDRRRPLPVAEDTEGLALDEIIGMAFGDDDKVLAIGYQHSTVLWNLAAPAAASGTVRLVRGGHLAARDGGTVLLRTSNTGLRLLQPTASGVQVWDVDNPLRPGARRTLVGAPGGFAVTLAYNPADADMLGIAGAPGAQLWDMRSSPATLMAQLPGAGPSQGGGLAFSPNGELVAVVDGQSESGRVALRRTSAPTAAPIATIADLADGAIRMQFSPDGRTLAIVDNAMYIPTRIGPPSVKLYDVSDPAKPTLEATLPGDVYSLAFSPSGRMLTAYTADTLMTWDVSDPRHPVPGSVRHLTRGSGVSAGAFRPDGGLLLVGDSMGTLRSWTIDHDQLVGEPAVVRTSSDLSELVFSPNGRMVAFTGNVHEAFGLAWIELWDFSDPGAPVRLGGTAITDDSLSLDALAFSPDGRQLAAVQNPGEIDLWDTDPQQVATRLCGTIGDPITPEQWRRYVPDLPYQPPCSG